MVGGISGEIRAATPTHQQSKDPASGYVPEIVAPQAVGKCSGHRCLRRRRAHWQVLGGSSQTKKVLRTKNVDEYDDTYDNSVSFEDERSQGDIMRIVSSPLLSSPEYTPHQSEEIIVSESPTDTKDDRLSAFFSSCIQCRRRCEEMVKRGAATDEREAFSGLSGGRYMCVRLDRRCWLEVEDTKHRYAKNLRRYHYEWLRLGRPEVNFFRWLDEDNPEFNLITCSRDKLETEVVRYCNSLDRRKYAIRCIHHLMYSQLCGNPETGGQAPIEKITGNSSSAGPQNPKSSACKFDVSSVASRWGLLNTGPKGWIFVLHDGILYARFKGTHAGKERFHHSSFFGGECVDAAGLIVAKDGVVTRLLPHSGHYRPREAHLARLLYFFRHKLGLELKAVEVDVQRLLRVARPEHSRKTDTPVYWSAADTLDFLERKALFKAAALHRGIIDRNLTPPPSLPADHHHTTTTNKKVHEMETNSGHDSHLTSALVPRAEAVMEHRHQSQQLEERLIAKNLLIIDQDSFEETGEAEVPAVAIVSHEPNTHSSEDITEKPATKKSGLGLLLPETIPPEAISPQPIAVPHTPPNTATPTVPPSTAPRMIRSRSIEAVLETRASSFPNETFLAGLDIGSHDHTKPEGRLAKSLAAGALYQQSGRSPSARDLWAFGRAFVDEQRNDPCDDSSDSDDQDDDDYLDENTQGNALEAAATRREERRRRMRRRRSQDSSTGAISSTADDHSSVSQNQEYVISGSVNIPRPESASSSSTMLIDSGAGPNSISPGTAFWPDFDHMAAAPPRRSHSKSSFNSDEDKALFLLNPNDQWTADEENIFQEEELYEHQKESNEENFDILDDGSKGYLDVSLRSFPLDFTPSDGNSPIDPREYLVPRTRRGRQSPSRSTSKKTKKSSKQDTSSSKSLLRTKTQAP